MEAQKWLGRTTFGADYSAIQSLVGTDAEEWLQAEIDKPASLYLSDLLARQSAGENIDGYKHRDVLWDNMIAGNDQLRTRMLFALSQLFVVSDDTAYNATPQIAYYMDVLSKNAFGNFRDLLEEVTYSSAMARYLTYWRNEKGDPATGRMPDENYAREVMQLFTIGVVELNQDGTPKLVNGKEVETFTNDDVEGLAKVFTGLSWAGPNFYQEDAGSQYKRLVMFDYMHSPEEKRFLGTVIPANTGGDESVKIALDTIFEHPNVAPFISRQLIQRFTASSPSPEYVKRVADVFDAGTFTALNGRVFGTGERGDLEATMAAILLDPSVNDDNNYPSEGKIREPVLKFVNWARAFDIRNIDSSREGMLDDTSSPSTGLGQQPMRSPSVFNFYRPGYVAPGTETGAQGLTAPEFQVVNQGSIVSFMNFMTAFIFDTSGPADNFIPDYSPEIAIADDAQALTDYLDLLLTGETMTDEAKADIVDAVSSIPVASDADREKRAKLAAFMTITSSAYAIQR
ncbi:hypothetical protein HY30_11755 [Hyphomonas chukchiensis]|uniref:DUF1800 domain-containing protein n=1 Tax=Hyphomonas chukchiensis TaxID=1280947 RepID=A0A062ULE1_9PROT|nr:hypothetical protein HY30_11755 [Hyphomonas chukchiensis]